jgi:23S rRNA pseudouridine955/2504/2580 synthase
MRMHEIAITEHEAGQRLDRWLRKRLANLPLGAIFKHLRSGVIRVDGKKADGDLRLTVGMRVQLRLPDVDLASGHRRDGDVAPARSKELPAELRPRIVHRDEHLLVLGKPAGLAVHGGSGIVHSVVDWLDAQDLGGRSATFRPSPAHRLDRGTAGLLVVGLSPAALRALTAAFRDGAVQKVYHAVVRGVPTPRVGAIDAPLAELEAPRAAGPKVAVRADGQAARTEYEVVRSGGGRALLAVRPQQGRQHQIRAHLAWLGHPIVGDRRYGEASATERVLLLHCSELAFPHPATGAPFVVREPLPAELRRAVATD